MNKKNTYKTIQACFTKLDLSDEAYRKLPDCHKIVAETKERLMDITHLCNQNIKAQTTNNKKDRIETFTNLTTHFHLNRCKDILSFLKFSDPVGKQIKIQGCDLFIIDCKTSFFQSIISTLLSVRGKILGYEIFYQPFGFLDWILIRNLQWRIRPLTYGKLAMLQMKANHLFLRLYIRYKKIRKN